mmetsp:Transcript_15145/g.30141  ORF Transcript_15145/g.30141 Transcript_15145/m.30141 type:complete len:258 (-) Transcript_15145:3-776(-)
MSTSPTSSPGGTKNIVPPRLHFIWLNPPLPSPHPATLQRWTDLNPSFTVTLWTPALIHERLRVPPWLKEVLESEDSNYGLMSDCLRYLILRDLGGVYLDLDYLPITGDLSFLLSKTAASCLSNTRVEGEVNNGFIASRAGGAVVAASLERCRVWWEQRKGKKSALQGAGIMRFLGAEDARRLETAVEAITPEETLRGTGPLMFTEVCSQLRLDVEVLPKEMFHGVANDAGEAEVESWIKRGVGVGVHLWEKRWVKRD